MELTPEGLWIDPGKITPETLLQFPGTTLDGLIDCGCNDCGLRYNPLPREPEFSAPVYKISNDQPITVDGVPINELPRLEQDAANLPIEAMPLQTLQSAEMPLPIEMPSPDATVPTLDDPSTDAGTTSNAGDAKILQEEEDTATVPAGTDGTGLNSSLIPELSVPGDNQ